MKFKLVSSIAGFLGLNLFAVNAQVTTLFVVRVFETSGSLI